ncbi:MAG: HlyD family efflux transporter periplasmic adaptor subunit [Vicinamibacterales bacterium]
MLRILLNRRLWLGVIVVAGLLAVALWPRTVPVDTAVLSRGPLRLTIDEEGKTRVRDRFVVAAPVSGRVLRIELEPGDTVTAGQVVARLKPESPALLDTRTRAESEAALESARATVGRAQADEERARAALTQAQRELTRTQSLVNEGLATRQQLDARTDDVKTADEALKAASFAARAAQSDVARAQVRLTPPALRDADSRVVPITSPVAGVVLKRVRESETVVPAGDPLLEIGDPHQLEIVADLLSVDAVRVPPSARVLVEQWGGNKTLDARVRRIEPSGFTKISALGVEEQRVNVIIDFTDPAEAWRALGDEFRVQTRTVLWESDDVLKVPTGALVRVGDAWAVYAVRDGRARRVTITLGHQNGQDAEVASGIDAGAVVILHPGDTIADDVRVAPRTTP